MTTCRIEILRASVDPLVAAPPAWAERVPRWQQIDAASYALAEAWHRWTVAGAAPALLAPDVFVLANRRASNEADSAFVRAGAFSPARFVATLPSVPLAAMLQTTGWEGPMLCIQAGPRTLASALVEAASLVLADPAATVGIVTFALRPSVVDVTYWGIGAAAAGSPCLLRVECAGTASSVDSASLVDTALDDAVTSWLERGAPGRLRLGSHWELER